MAKLGKNIFILLLVISLPMVAVAFDIRGRVISTTSRQGIPYAAVVVDGNYNKGAATDSLGYFTIENLAGGIVRFEASSIGYTTVITPEYITRRQHLLSKLS